MSDPIKNDAKPAPSTPPEGPSPTDSSAKETDVQQTEPATQPSDSSSDKEPSPLDSVIEQAFKKSEPPADTEKEEEEPSDESGEEEESEEDSEGDETQSEKDEETLPFHNHPRFKELIEERNVLKDRTSQLDKLVDFRKNYGISDEQFTSGMELLALLNTDPAKAREMLKPYMEQLDTLVGERLPADLAQEVEEGVLTEARAKELARFRQTTQHNKERQQQTIQQQHQTQLVEQQTAVNGWEQTKVKSDPDFRPNTPKYNLVVDRYGRLYQSATPKNALEAVQLAERAYTEITQEISKFMPRPSPRKTLATNGSTTKVKAEAPRSPQEAAARAFAQHE